MIIKNARRTAIALVLVAVAAVSAQAQTVNQLVTVSVGAINQFSMTAPNVTLAINSAAAGSQPTQATATGGTWAVTTNQTNASVSAAITAGTLPGGLTLKASMGAPSVGASAGYLSLPASPASVVLSNGITKVADLGMPVGYTLDALASAGVVAATVLTVTYTLTAGT